MGHSQRLAAALTEEGASDITLSVLKGNHFLSSSKSLKQSLAVVREFIKSVH